MDKDDDLNFEDDNLLPGPSGQDNEGELEIEIQDDTPEEDRGRPALAEPPVEPTEEELAQYSEGVRKRISQLTHARHDERRAREQLEREHQSLAEVARRAMAENERLKSYVKAGETQYVSLSVKAAEDKVTAARQKLVQAQTDFDAEETAKAMEELSDAKAELAQAKSFKPMELQENKGSDTLPPTAQAKPQIHEKTVSWRTRNTWFGHPDHEDASSFALGLHKKLVESGVDPRTDEYFDKIDAGVKSRFPELYPQGSQQQTKPTQQPARSITAPVSRSNGTPNGKTRVVLTKSELDLCKTLGITPQQYAAQKLQESTNV